MLAKETDSQNQVQASKSWMLSLWNASFQNLNFKNGVVSWGAAQMQTGIIPSAPKRTNQQVESLSSSILYSP